MIEQSFAGPAFPLYTPDNIISVEQDEIFVFGSNDAGRHGRGAAKVALSFGAKYGRGEGLQGNSYAIPTKDRNLKVKSLFDIQISINTFLKFVEDHAELHFLLTKVGCGEAKYTIDQIAPLFKKGRHLTNLSYPQEFIEHYERTDS